MALQFYRAVAGVNNFYAPQPLVTLTGHSLGGGLAGFVGALSGNQVYGYDHMPFGIAAYAQAISDSVTAAAARLGLAMDDLEEAFPLIDGLTYAIVAGISFGAFVEAFEIEYAARVPIIRMQGTHIEGEILQGVRDGSLQPAIGGAVGALLGFLGGGLAGSVAFSLIMTAAGLAIGSTTVELESAVITNDYPAYATGIGTQVDLTSVQRHSMPYLVTVMFAHEQWPTEGLTNSSGNWSNGFGYVAPSLFSTQIAKLGLRLGSSTGAADPATQMATMIAYSAINEGTRVFGDTGIRAMSNDTADLGRVLSLPGASQALFSGTNGIGAVIVEYAGLLAVAQVLSANNAAAANGILSYRQASATRAETLMIDLREATWDAYGRNHTLVSRDELIEGFFAANITTGPQLLNRIEQFYANVSGVDLLSSIDRVSISLGGELRPAQLIGDGMLLSVLSDDGVTASYTGKTDFVIGGAGDDILSGLGGHDILIGGGGADTLLGGNGRDFLYGGTGADTLEGGAGGDQLWSGPSRGFGFDDFDVLTGGDGNDVLNFSGGYGRAIGGAGNDVIDARLALSVGIVYRTGDGNDSLRYNSYDRENMSIFAPPTRAGAGFVYLGFPDLRLSDVRIEWRVSIIDGIVEPDGEMRVLCVGIVQVFALDGSLLFDLGEISGIVIDTSGTNALGGYIEQWTIPDLEFVDGQLIYSYEASNIRIDIVAEDSPQSQISSSNIVSALMPARDALDMPAFALANEMPISSDVGPNWHRVSMPLFVENFV